MSLWILGALALIPTAVAGAGMVRSPADRAPAARASTSSVASLFLFVTLADGYMMWQVVM